MLSSILLSLNLDLKKDLIFSSMLVNRFLKTLALRQSCKGLKNGGVEIVGNFSKRD